MNDLEALNQRVSDLERRQSELEGRLSGAAGPNGNGVARRRSHRAGRVFMGIFIIAVGLLWLGQSYGIEWLLSIRLWPFALILFGVYMIFGGRDT